jgi:hypothetical protein
MAASVGVYTKPLGERPRTCMRCGHRMAYSRRKNDPICRDCRSADPEYLRLIEGTP